MGASLTSLAVALGFPYQAPGAGGAARYRSYVYPDPSGLLVVAASPANTGVRGRIATTGPTILSTGFGGGFTNLPALVNGIAGALLTNTPGSGMIRLQGQICNIKTARTNVQSAVADDSTCYSIWANLACSDGSPNTNDQGLYMVSPGGTLQRLIIDGGPGFGFLIGQTGIVSFVVRGPNGLIITPVTAAPFDITKHHSYKMLITGVTPSSNGSLTALIDGIAVALPALSRSWGPGTNLPPNATISAESGFAPAVITSNGVVNSTTHVQQVGVAMGPTLGSLL